MKLEYKSLKGDILTLSKNEYFTIANIDGMTSGATSISSNVKGGSDGDTVNNIQAQPRPIIIDLRINPQVDVEKAKREILKVVKLKQRGFLVWTQNERTLTISGVVESIDMPRWNNAVIMQIALYCSVPYWEDIENIVSQISDAINLHYFTNSYNNMLYFPETGIALGEYDTIRTRTLHNSGDVSTGIEITIKALDTVTNPIIYDGNGNYFGIGYAMEYPSTNPNIGGEWVSKPFVMKAGDTVIITTHKGNKTVKYNGVSVLNLLKPNSKWLQLETGDNTFSINSDDESIKNMYFNISYKRRFV